MADRFAASHARADRLAGSLDRAGSVFVRTSATPPRVTELGRERYCTILQNKNTFWIIGTSFGSCPFYDV